VIAYPLRRQVAENFVTSYLCTRLEGAAPLFETIERLESNVRGYARLFPTVFRSALGSHLVDINGRTFIDFFCGAGSLNYGHNHRGAKAALLNYITSDGIQLSLDTMTEAKIEFLEKFERIILRPRQLDYRVQFTGPTGTNAVEAAIKLARKQTGRSHVIAFTNAYHGHSLGALALTGNQYYHSEFYGSRINVTHMPYDGYMGTHDTAELLEKMLTDKSSGVPIPAAVILETVQGEGGINVASLPWLKQIEVICKRFDIRLIVDDIQVGNGRTGKFFSFEHAGITPDLVCVSKSIGGGLPMSLVLIRQHLDTWKPGEHTGTFRGNNLAFVAATAVLEHWADTNAFESQIAMHGKTIEQNLRSIAARHKQMSFDVRGRGMIWGLDVKQGELAARISRSAFDRGLMLEGCGADDQVLKLMPALTIDDTTLQQGLRILVESVADHVPLAEPSLPNVSSVPSLLSSVNYHENGSLQS